MCAYGLIARMPINYIIKIKYTLRGQTFTEFLIDGMYSHFPLIQS